jgi:hypothetical protein
MDLVTSHFWRADRLYEADYYKAVGKDGRAQFVKVYMSERQCRCPGREMLERQRRGVREAARA